MMALYKYFKRNDKLPDVDGPLKQHIPSQVISVVNKEVEAVIYREGGSCKTRGPYMKVTDAQKAVIGKRAAEHSVTASIRYFSKMYPDIELKETSVRRFKNAYIDEAGKRRHDEDSEVRELLSKKRRRPLLLGEELEKQVKTYLIALCTNGAVVNTAITIACAHGIVISKDANLLSTNGGHINLSKHWAKSFLQRMGFVKRKGTTKAKITVENFDSIKQQFLLDIKNVVQMDEIPFQLVINWDHTGIHYVPVSDWTMEKEGSKRIPIVGIDDKRQLTAVFTGSLAGDFLVPQLIYQGKSPRSLPLIHFPNDWHVTFSPNHWSNEETMKCYIQKIIIPYIVKKREELKLAAIHPALVVFDNFNGQCTEDLFQILDDNVINFVIVPANCTDRLQPLDLSVNKAAKISCEINFRIGMLIK